MKGEGDGIHSHLLWSQLCMIRLGAEARSYLPSMYTNSICVCKRVCTAADTNAVLTVLKGSNFLRGLQFYQWMPHFTNCMFHAVKQSSLLSTSLVLTIGKQCHTINNSETSRSENWPAERLPENAKVHPSLE